MKRIFFALALTIAATAHADVAPPPGAAPTPPASTSGPRSDVKPVQAFGDDKPNCLEWTDGCIVCKRQSDKTVACSLVGIACVQSTPICTKTAQ